MHINKGTKQDLINICLYGILTVLFFYPVIFQGKVFYFGDIHYSFYPHQKIIFDSFRQGRLPLWNPYIFCGLPLLANIAQSALYPIKFLFLFLPFIKAFNFLIVFHYFLAGVFTYIMMRMIKKSHVASFISGLVFMLNCPIILEYTNMFLLTIVWIPLVFAFFYKTIEKLSLKWAMLTGLILSIQFLSGSPQHVYFSILLMISYLIFFYPSKSILGEKSRFYPLFLFLMVGLISLSISMIQLAPTLEFILHSSRGQAMTYQESVLWSLHPSRLIQILIPHFFGEVSHGTYFWGGFLCNSPYKSFSPSYMKSLYVGLLTIVMFIYTLKYIKNRSVMYLVLVFIFFLFVSFGQYTPLYYLLYKTIPLFSAFRWPVKYFILCVFCLSILVGIGIDYLLESEESHRQKKDPMLRFLGIAFLVTILSGTIFFLFYVFKTDSLIKLIEQYIVKNDITLSSHMILSIIRKELIYFLLSCSLLFLIFKLWLNRIITVHSFKILIICIVVFDLFWASMQLDFFTTPELYGYQSALSEKIIQNDGNRNELFRILSHHYEPPPLWHPDIQNWESLTEPEMKAFWRMAQIGPNIGLSDYYYLNGGSALFFRDYPELEKISQKKPIEILRALNVKYLILDTKKNQGFDRDKIWPFYNLILVKVLNYKPRIYMISQAIFKKEKGDILQTIAQESFDMTSIAVINENPTDMQVMAENDMPIDYRCEIMAFSPEDVVVKVKSNGPGYLIFTDFYFDGWRAYIDDKPTKLFRANYFFKGVRIDKGEHTVKFEYVSKYLGIGALITLTTLLAMMAFFLKDYKSFSGHLFKRR